SPERQPYLRAELETIFALKTADEWQALLKDVDCCFALVNPPAALGDDPQVQTRGLVGRDEDGAPWMRSPVRLDGDEIRLGSVPGYGEHTREILNEAGYSESEIEGLLTEKIVKT